MCNNHKSDVILCLRFNCMLLSLTLFNAHRCDITTLD